ncbi:hypothetical protein DFR72_108113 [Lentzea flaviverrucosa]|uniref:Uncharacterized protein n=2 Tax=Lentzea flaviverrucosa TaxID=200379 RepID=A0A1H9SMT3_9PSEU|nr:hypothetical protein DFR72_108113 [Lentzea flaviverrucosa]SER85693.1 hypothetical protein SAMN05216195_107114 [Lentzea flaviverrucosa]
MTMTLIDWSARISAMADALSVLDGGFSVDPRDGSDVRCGYAVAVHPEHECVYERRVTSSDIHEYVSAVKGALSLPGRVLGGWCDPMTGRVYLDVSVVTADLSEAITLAAETGQLAIFDFAAMTSIPVPAPSVA